MVQTDISQISAECQEWRQVLRNYRDEFHENQKELEALCKSNLSKDQLQLVEHFQNQFHIQLINIHDLKQAIKNHERKLAFETVTNNNISEDMLNQHEDLYGAFSNIELTLMELRNEFREFSSQIS